MDEQKFQPGAYDPRRLPPLRDVITPLFRHRKIVLFTFLGVVVATVLGIVLLPNDYEAKMKILVKRERVDAAVSPGRDTALANSGDVTEEELNSEVELLKSRDLLEKVVVSCDLQDPRPTAFWNQIFPTAAARGNDAEPGSAKDVSQAVWDLENKLEIEPLKKTDLIQVTYDSSDPQLAAAVTDPDHIEVGQEIRLPRPSDPVISSSAAGANDMSGKTREGAPNE